MARVSRKNNNSNNNKNELFYTTAIYTRLSVEQQEDTSNESMQNQINIVTNYAKKQKDIVIYKVYSDNGFTGTNFNRPAFENMMDDITSHEVNCVIVKDFSRLGRNYIECGYLMERTFKSLGVRFISVNDNYDSLYATNSDKTMVAFKNMVNNMYSNDLSKKVKSAMSLRASNGEYLNGTPPYGFLKSDTERNKLIIDEEVAPIIREIFELRANKKSGIEICKHLNEKNIVSPAYYSALKYNKSIKNVTITWNTTTICRFLYNELFIGNFVYSTNKSKDDCLKIQDNHEGIVNKELFYEVQKINKDFKYRNNRNPETNKKRIPRDNLFKSFIFCKDCNRVMKFFDTVRDGYVFSCRLELINRNSNNSCSYKKINEKELKELVLKNIRYHINLAYDYQRKIDLFKKDKSIIDEQNKVKNRFNKINKDIAKLTDKKTKLYEKYFDEKIELNEYLKQQKIIEHTEIILTNQMKELEIEKASNLQCLEDNNKWLKNLLLYDTDIDLNREILTTLIEKIYICEENKIQIIWKYQSDLLKFDNDL